jgi:folate-binding protein YgfZ
MLAEFHQNHARAFVDVGGTQIPVYYESAGSEFQAAQTAAMMDRSFIGKLRVFGKDRETLLHRLTTNEMRHLKIGGGVVNIFTNAKGRVVDIVEMFAEENSFFLLTSPGRAALVKAWIEKYTFIEDVRSEEVTSQYGVISLFGGESAARLQQVFGWHVNELPAQQAQVCDWEGQAVVVQRSGAIAPVDFNLIVPAVAMEKFWEALLPRVTPLGFAAYERLRIHRGLPAVDREITDEYNPHEVGLYPFINFDKGCYIGQEVIARLDTYQKVQRQLFGIELEIDENQASRLASTPAPIYAGEQLIGQLTSLCFSPERGGGLGLAVIRKQFAAAEPVQVRWPAQTVAGRLQTLKF